MIIDMKAYQALMKILLHVIIAHLIPFSVPNYMSQVFSSVPVLIA